MKRIIWHVSGSMKAKSIKKTTLPTPNNPGNPENPPPAIPIPGKSPDDNEPQSFKCSICGNVYNSKEEIDEHMHEHNR